MKVNEEVALKVLYKNRYNKQASLKEIREDFKNMSKDELFTKY